ncbi:MAG: response regulator [Spirochaetota bacterium]
MQYPLLTVQILYEEDIVQVRQRAKTIAKECGFSETEQIRISTAVSEISRNAYQYAGGGTAEFIINADARPAIFAIYIKDKGKGIPNIHEIVSGEYKSKTGLGIGIIGARKFMEFFTIDTSEHGTTVFMGKPIPQHIHIDEKKIQSIVAALAIKNDYDPLVILRQQNKELIHALEEIKTKQDELETLNKELEETNRGVLALYSEISEKATTLSRVNELKTKFISNMSHEFKTPLNAIISLSRILLDKVDGNLTAEQEKQVRFIMQSAENLHTLINDLLDLAKIEAGKVTVNTNRFTVEELFSSLRGIIRPLLTSPNVALIFEDPINFPQLETDDVKLSQILRNLLSNAVKFTEYGEIRVSAKLETDGTTILFMVKDTGIGIAKDNLDKIFDEYSQLSQKPGGTGLGLSISKNLAKILGGELWAESEVGKGSVFYLRIPIVYQAPDALQKSDGKPFIDATRFPVLVIEDDEVTRLLYDKYLKNTGVQVFLAGSIREAKNILQSVKPVAIILDILLPNEDSWEFLSELKSKKYYENIPVICATVVEEQDKGFMLGAFDYIVKPVERSTLLQKLQSIIKGYAEQKVLIIDDDEIAHYVIKGYLADTRFSVIEAFDGFDGLKKAKEYMPDVILLDLIMPGMSGFEVLEQLKSDTTTKEIPVIILSSKILEEEDRKKLEGNVVSILTKDAPSRDAAIQKIKNTLVKALRLDTHGGGD